MQLEEGPRGRSFAKRLADRLFETGGKLIKPPQGTQPQPNTVPAFSAQPLTGNCAVLPKRNREALPTHHGGVLAGWTWGSPG